MSIKEFKILIFLPGRKRSTGGHVVLHKLVKILSDLGISVWCTEEPLFDCSANIITKNEEEEFDLSFLEEDKKYVAIYPEQVEGNPFGIKNVCRWILYHTRENIEETWEPKDEYFYFQPGFTTKRIEDRKKMLTVLDTKASICVNKGLGNKRKGYCHINKKKYPTGETLLKSLESTDLGDFMQKGGFDYLIEELNKHEYFVTYDDSTHYSVIAAMCGCRSVVIRPDVMISPDEYREKYPTRKYGVAFGWEDLKHADLTRDLVKDHMKRFEKSSLEQIKKFLAFWQERLYPKES